MKLKLFLNALFSARNMGVLLIAIAIAYILNIQFPALDIFIYPGAAALYLGFVLQSLFSSSFHEQFNRKQKIKQIRKLNYLSNKLAAEARRYTNTTYRNKLGQVMEDKEDILKAFYRGEHSYLKERIVEQALNLVVSYIKLLTNFCIRSRELSEVDISAIVDRINSNTRKAGFINDPAAAEDMIKLIEMDKNRIEVLKEEKRELERISTKLDYMEGTVNMFKHQIIANIESEDMVETLETAVNEASALDSVLQERRRNRVRL